MSFRTIAALPTLLIAVFCYYIDVSTSYDGMHIFWTLGAFLAMVEFFNSHIQNYLVIRAMKKLAEDDPEVKKLMEQFNKKDEE